MEAYAEGTPITTEEMFQRQLDLVNNTRETPMELRSATSTTSRSPKTHSPDPGVEETKCPSPVQPCSATRRAPHPEPDPTAAEFSFRNVTRTFPADGGMEFIAVRDINLDIKPCSFVCLIGPSGCGKTTLLGMAAGLLRPTTGEVDYRGKQVKSVNTSVGFITQHDNLLPWRTVEKNVAIALEIQNVPKQERKRRVAEVLELVGLTKFAKRYPSQLSGGMQKRASLARGLVYGPSTLLMDEPFGALDAQLRLDHAERAAVHLVTGPQDDHLRHPRPR